MKKLIVLIGFLSLGCAPCLDLPYPLIDQTPTPSLPREGFSFHGAASVLAYSGQYEVRPSLGLGAGFGSRVRVGGYLRGGAVYWFDDCDSTWKVWPMGTFHLAGGVAKEGVRAGLELWAGAPLFLGASLNLGLGEPERLSFRIGLFGAEAKLHAGPLTLGGLLYADFGERRPVLGLTLGFSR